MKQHPTFVPIGHMHERGTDKLLAAIADARELTPLERKRIDAENLLKSVQGSFPNERIVACSGCSRPTLGSFGPSGMLWRTVCQSCKDKADADLDRCCATLGKVNKWTMDTIMERVRRDVSAADSATKHEKKPTITSPEDVVDPVAAPLAGFDGGDGQIGGAA